jgi:Spy/CpxP family protein refolding chaperone
MRAIRLSLTAVCVVALVGLSAAQPPRGRPGGPGGPGGGMMLQGGMMRGGSAMLLMNEGVQKELKISDDQKDKLKDITDKQREKMREQFAAIRDGGEVDREQMQATMKELAESGERAIKQVLNADQQKRLKQIVWQQAGAMVFLDKEYAAELKITADQTEQLKKIGEEFQEDMRALAQTARDNREEFRQKAEALRGEVKERALEVLTPEQRKMHKELLGPPFELKFDPNQMRERGGFRKGGDDKGGDGKGGQKKARPKRGDG